MARVVGPLTNFTAGELSPLLDGRIDLVWYPNGTRTSQNMVSLPHGPSKRREGAGFVYPNADAAKRSRLIDFEFNVEQAYILEFNDEVIRVFRNRGVVVTAPDTPVEIVSPYLEAQLRQIKTTQSADVLYLVHGAQWPQTLSRTSHTLWDLAEFEPVDGPWFAENVTATTLDPAGGTTGAITIAASSTVGLNGGQGFLATDVKRLVRIKHGAVWGYAKITAVNSTTNVDATVVKDLGDTTASAAWQLGAWSATTGYPTAVIFHGERLWFLLNNRADGSRVADFSNFTPGTNDDDPITLELVANQVPIGRWLASEDTLLVGTAGSEFKVSSGALNEPLTPANTGAKQQTRWGSADMSPIQAGNANLFGQRAGTNEGFRSLREQVFDGATERYKAADLSRRANHLTRQRIVEMAYQKDPWSIVWAVRADGVLLALSYVREEEVVAWTPHPMGASAAAPAVVESVAVIPGVNQDEVWLSVKRTIDGQDFRSIEVLNDEFDEDQALEDAFFVDCGVTYDGAPTTTITGAGHLEGETVQILADGAVHTPQEVTGGQFTLTDAASKVHFGLGYTSILKTNRLDHLATKDAPIGAIRRIRKVIVRLLRCGAFQLGSSEDKLDAITFRKMTHPLGAPTPLFSGDHEIDFKGAHNRDPAIVAVQSDPLPLTVVGYTVE
jgi:hypothetical protein